MFNSKKDASKDKLDSGSSNLDTFNFESDKMDSSGAEGQRVLQEIMQNRSKSAYSTGSGLVSGNENELALSSASGNMTVGPGVRMEGAIRHFENLIILGSSEGELEGENLTIGEGGWLKGTATIRNMEVVGHFQGTADVAGHVLLRSSGTVDGTISYTSMEIENGGQITGEMRPTNKRSNDETVEVSELNFPETTSTEIIDSLDASVVCSE